MRCIMTPLIIGLATLFPMITHTPLVAGNLPIKPLVAMAMANKEFYMQLIDFQFLSTLHTTTKHEMNYVHVLHVAFQEIPDVHIDKLA